MRRGNYAKTDTAALASATLIASPARAQDVYDSTPRLIEACRNIETEQKLRLRWNSNQMPRDIQTAKLVRDAADDAPQRPSRT